MKRNISKQQGMSIVELMISATLGLMILNVTYGIYLAEIHTHKTSSAQAAIHSAENAISALVTPVLRTAGFCACSSCLQAISNLNPGGAPPLGDLQTSPSIVRGYNANGNTLIITQANPENNHNASQWTPALHSSLQGLIAPGSDVITLIGGIPGTQAIGVTAETTGSHTVLVQNSTDSGLTSGGYAAISDCLKASIFRISNLSTNSLTHTASQGTLNNTQDTLTEDYAMGAQLAPLQQTAFFVAHSNGSQSALMRATLNGTSWLVEPIVPGVENLQIQYGIGANGLITRYVNASAVTDWSAVYAVRLGFLIAGKTGSGSAKVNITRTQTVLDNTVTTPMDNRLRHVFHMTIYLRNAS